MWNYKQAQSDALGDAIKERLKSSLAVQKIFEEFEVSLDRLDQLRIEVVPLEKKYAETDGEVMNLNTALFDGGDFWEKYFFVIVHEIVHWLSRVKEEDSYFQDPEETLGFVLSIAYEIEQGSDFDTIYNKIYPKVSFHFHNEEDAVSFFNNMYQKALKILN